MMDYINNYDLPALDETIRPIQDDTDIENALYKAFLDNVSEKGFDNVTFKAATVFDRKGYATMIELGKPKNPYYSRDSDTIIIQMSVAVEIGDRHRKSVEGVDYDLTKIREDKELAEKQQKLAEKQQKLDEAREAFEKAQQDLEDAQRSI